MSYSVGSLTYLLEEKKLKKSDFVVTENYHIQLKEQTAKMLIEKIKLNMNAKEIFRGRNAAYQTILSGNIQGLAHFVIGKNKALSFDIPSITLRRNVGLDIRQRILSMMPSQRKRLGINKSTLWYQKRNLERGKSIKVYGKVLPRLG